jgi:putative ABC transport system ATP-binding protein
VVLSHIEKNYSGKGILTHALRALNLAVARHEFVAVCGKSGCGKSTLLNLIGAMDRPDSGNYHFGEKDVLSMNLKELALFRRSEIGFVFQAFHLVPEMTALENVEMPMGYAGLPKSRRREKAMQLLERVGLSEKSRHKPPQLSGGEQQRVAVARALVNEPQLILADEPTGNLDEANSLEIMRVLKEIHAAGTTIIMVTHDSNMADFADRLIRMKDGTIVMDTMNGSN